MPGFTTHYLFGVKAYNDLPNNYLKHVISKYRWLYQIGLQGPDIFFYNIPILRHRDYRNVGSHMHEYHVNRFFRNCLNEIAAISSKQQREQAIPMFTDASSMRPTEKAPGSMAFTRSWKMISIRCFYGSSSTKSHLSSTRRLPSA